MCDLRALANRTEQVWVTLTHLVKNLTTRNVTVLYIKKKKKKVYEGFFYFCTFYKRIISFYLFPLCMQFSSVQSLSRVRLFATPWITARQDSLSITISWSSLKLTSIELVITSSHLILCRPFFLLPPIPPSISLCQWVNSLHEVAKVLEFQL